MSCHSQVVRNLQRLSLMDVTFTCEGVKQLLNFKDNHVFSSQVCRHFPRHEVIYAYLLVCYMNVSNYFLSSQSPAVASMSNSRSALNGRFIPTKLNTAFPPTRISKVPFLGLHVWSLSFLAQLSHPGLIAMAPWSCPRIA